VRVLDMRPQCQRFLDYPALRKRGVCQRFFFVCAFARRVATGSRANVRDAHTLLCYGKESRYVCDVQ